MNAIASVKTKKTGWWYAVAMISSLDQNPDSGKMPAIESDPIRKVRYVFFILFFNPPIS